MNRELPSDQMAEIRRLIQSLHDGRITDEDKKRLQQWMREDEEASWLYVQYMNLYAGLHWDIAQDSSADHVESLDPPPKPISPVLGFLGECWNQGISFFSKSSVFSLLVAIGLPGVILVMVVLSLIHQAPPSPVAIIARSRDCAGRIDDRPSSLYPGRDLFAKQRLVIDEGVVEIKFADGAAVVLEGPAAFEIRGGNAGSLTEGRLAAVVPPEARGFAVETPSATVVDLGTEFGVWVDNDGRVETHVFGGQVEVVMPPESADVPGETTLLVEGEAVHIAAADASSTSPRIVRIPAAAQQFARSVELPEPTVLFAHHGSADPTGEGWTAHYRQYGENLPRDGKNLGRPHLVAGPIDEAGTAAWRVQPLHDDKQVSYVIRKDDGLTREMRAEAREKGWVLRARVWIGGKGPRADQGPKAPCYIVYRDEERSWRLWLLLDQDGNQFARIPEFDVGAVPGSRNQYVDYELRYHPVKKNAELFVNGRRAATHKGSPNGDTIDEDDGAFSTIRFGTYRVPTEVRFTKIEWGILGDTEGK